ncbi:MAG: hypothetical protein K2K14_08320, partial [Ruminococcus sp.]|nr:hypothetical protein [Ruminococcus sp.]
ANVVFNLYRLRALDNIPKVKSSYINTTTIEEIYSTYQHCLWPLDNIDSDIVIKEYSYALRSKGATYLYRKEQWRNDKGVFSSSDARNIVERLFVKIGIELLNGAIGNDCLYPLGFDCFPSWGFGSFLASDLNISNTCPLVLWSEASGWNPLFKRRTKYNSINTVEMVDFENWELTDNEVKKLNPHNNLFGI